MNKKNLAAYAAVAVAFAALGAWAGFNKEASGPVTTTIAPTDGRPHTAVDNLFAMTLDDAAGRPQPLSQWKGQLLVVNFWATWCAPCVDEMPELSELATLQPRVKVIGIGIDSPKSIADFAAKYKISYPLYTAGMAGTDLGRQLGNEAGGLPYTVVIGADGQVKKTYLGRLKFDQLKADLATM